MAFDTEELTVSTGPSAVPMPRVATPDTPSAPATEAATEAPATEAPDSVEPTTEASAAVVEFTLVAQDTAFDTGELTVRAGADVRLTLENEDPLPHNFALYLTDAAEESVYVGETFSGPGASHTYEFTAPTEPGEYFFRCDNHPQLMSGAFIVE